MSYQFANSFTLNQVGATDSSKAPADGTAGTAASAGGLRRARTLRVLNLFASE
ncbi:hypothetical protein [Massilia psychrophila]|uniref:hypothetical protein n=1 Tax=Massilia psychrophila TaxID=1603353 RepID=UPI0015D4AF4E|nr:hypothetical protein [Massilia psychrophila]